jgi:hypothetical protein
MSRLTSTIIAAASAALVSLALAGCVAQSSSQKSGPATPENFHLLMPPQSLLQEDTVEAASHDRNSSRLAYVGVWAKSGDACAMMDQTAFDGYAVITPGSLRHPGETCSFEPGAPGQGNLQFDASCKVKRKARNRTIVVEMQNSRSMRLSIDGESRSMVRCYLPE